MRALIISNPSKDKTKWCKYTSIIYQRAIKMSPDEAIFEKKLYRKVLRNPATTHEDLLEAQLETRESSPRPEDDLLPKPVQK